MSAVDTVYAVLSEVSGIPRAEIRPENDLAGDLGIDSPRALRLLVGIEDQLDIEISDEDAAAMETVGDIVKHVESL